MKDREGMALVTILLLTSILVLMTLSMMFISTNHMAIMGSRNSRVQALRAAQAGIEYAIYRLDKEPDWGLSNLKFIPGKDPNAMPTFSPDLNAGEEISLTKDSGFRITFSNSNSKYMSVNNLFESDPNIASSTGVPCYSAKIVSVGTCGSAKKIIEAYLVRSDYFPYTINSDGIIILKDGSYSIRGSKHDSSESTEPNTYPPGSLYSGWKTTPTPAYSMEVNNAVKSLNMNGGLIACRNLAKIPDGIISSSNIKKNYPKEIYMSKIDVEKILERADAGEYGFVKHVSPGVTLIGDEMPATYSYPGCTLHSYVITQGSADIFTFDSTNEILKLKQNIFIDGDTSLVNGDCYKSWTDLCVATPAAQNMVKIYPDNRVWFREHETVTWLTYTDPNTGITSGPTPYKSILDPTAWNLTIDLNGYNIYSRSHIMIGLPVKGKGKIISLGKISCILGANNGETTLISAQDLDINLSECYGETHNSGFYYASDDIAIQPLPLNNFLASKPTPVGTGYPRISMEYPAGYKLYNLTPPASITGIGEYDPSANDEPEHPWWMKDYKGNGIIARKGEYDSGGSYIIEITGIENNPIMLYLEDNKKQIKIEPTPGEGITYMSIIIDVNGTNCTTSIEKISGITGANGVNIQVKGETADPAEFNLTQDELDTFGKQVAASFIGNKPQSHNIRAPMVNLNKYISKTSDNKENQSHIDGGTGGTVVLLHNQSYMKSMLNIERKTFNVRLVASYEID